MKIVPLCMVTALLVCASAGSQASPLAAREGVGGDLLGLLSSGGYVIYQRHALTDTTRGDADPVDLKDCSTQRPLSDAGRTLAHKIGAAFRVAHIPVGEIVSSPYCRAVETAALEFPALKRSTSNALSYSLALPKDQATPRVLPSAA